VPSGGTGEIMAKKKKPEEKKPEEKPEEKKT
jgi:hypothetical protein